MSFTPKNKTAADETRITKTVDVDDIHFVADGSTTTTTTTYTTEEAAENVESVDGSVDGVRTKVVLFNPHGCTRFSLFVAHFGHPALFFTSSLFIGPLLNGVFCIFFPLR